MADGKVIISTALNNKGLLSGLKSVKGSLGGLASVAAGVSASIVTAFGAAAVSIVKQSTDAYAAYEQLIGGVETLFKDSASDVVAYAEDAFYTVGMSANEYMETVTGFSASLISSLGGDTKKAAAVADMALTDMADNANKMGTALESVKSAYMGFAKGQFQLLDNLKLGYGGSRTEMERLLRDAEKLTGVKYDINNLADVYNAIHAIQEKLGVAGATALEAEKTIAGSSAMTAAAWKNVLTAIAGGGDLDKAINNLVFSVSKYFENIVPVVERSLEGVGELIEQIAPALVETIARSLIRALPSLISAVYKMIIGFGNGIYQGLIALMTGAQAEVAAELNKSADGLADIAGGYDDVADAAENAAKAQKSLAGFDEITKLGRGTDSTDEAGGAAVSATVSVKGVEEATTQAKGLAAELQQIFAPFVAIFEDILPPIKEFWDGTLRPIFMEIGEWIGKIVDQTMESFGYLASKVEEHKDEIAMAVEGIGAILQMIWAVISPIISAIVDGIGNVLRTTIDWIFAVITALGNFFNFFKNIGAMFVAIFKGDFDAAGEYAKQALGNLVNVFVGVANAIISILNNLWTIVFDAFRGCVNSVAGVINKLGNFAGFDWNLQWNATAPLIPLIPRYVPALARGAVLPPNKPFMAMVGDQTHGTNVEAPLAVIEEAVAAVMEDMVQSNIAGHEATVAVLREILEAVLGIQIGDDVIGQAVARYNAKMAVIKGGAV